MAHKFLIVNNQFRWSSSIKYHFELLQAKESRQDTAGGGLFYVDRINKKIYLYHKSEDFGYSDKETIIKALDRTLISDRYDGYKVFISKTDTLEVALEEQEEDYVIDLSKPLIVDELPKKEESFTINNYRKQVYTVPNSVPVRVEKIGRNEPCKCGSGQKYKRCCGK